MSAGGIASFRETDLHVTGHSFNIGPKVREFWSVSHEMLAKMAEALLEWGAETLASRARSAEEPKAL